ncbi:MAG: hypothetical protein KDD56_01315 [Bdellovibrionales bacterium]|nr:hypothetical protein [Bdellovibrionales bacterium]
MSKFIKTLLLIAVLFTAQTASAEFTLEFKSNNGAVAGVSIEGNSGFGDIPGRVSNENGRFTFEESSLSSPNPTIFFQKEGFQFKPAALILSESTCPAKKCIINVTESTNPEIAIFSHAIASNANPVEGIRFAIVGSELTETTSDSVGTAINVIKPVEGECNDTDNDPFNNTIKVFPLPPQGKTCTFNSIGADTFCPKKDTDIYKTVVANCTPASNSSSGTYVVKVVSDVSNWGVLFRGNNGLGLKITNRSGEIKVPVDPSSNYTLVGYTTAGGTLYPPTINVSNKSKDCIQNVCLVYLQNNGNSSAIEWSFTDNNQPVPGVTTTFVDGLTKKSYTSVSDNYGKVVFPGTLIPEEKPDYLSKINANLEGYRFDDPTGNFHRYVNQSFLTGSYIVHEGSEDTRLYDLTGKVFNSLGDPLGGISMQLNDGQANYITDQNGFWTIKVESGQQVNIKPVEKDGYKFDPELVSFDPITSAQEINFVAKLPDKNSITPPEDQCEIDSDDGSYLIRGTVVDANGKAIPNVEILNRDSVVTKTSHIGFYEFKVGPKSNNWVVARLTQDSGIEDIAKLTPDPAGYTFHSYDTACNKNITNFRFINKPSLIIAGIVKYKDSASPMPGFKVIRELGDGSPALSTTTDGTGHYIFSVPIETSYEIKLGDNSPCWQTSGNYKGSEIIDSKTDADFDVLCPGQATPTPSPTPQPTPNITPVPTPTAPPAPDFCPSDPAKTAPGVCGCGIPDKDSDGDGTLDCNDSCPTDKTKLSPGICGCGQPDLDADNDGVYQCQDKCDTDPNKLSPGLCGCGVIEDTRDSDKDGTINCLDLCPSDQNKNDPGICGCGISDADNNNDGNADCNDTFKICHIPTEYPGDFIELKVPIEEISLHLAHGDIEGSCDQLPNKHNACAGVANADNYHAGKGENNIGQPNQEFQKLFRVLGSPELDDSENFLTLGLGGSVELSFGENSAIYNQEGIDFYLAETSYEKRGRSCEDYPEKAEVFGTEDGSNWVSLGSACRDAGFDLENSGLRWVRKLKIVDNTTLANSDGYDIDGITCADTTKCLDSDKDGTCDYEDNCKFDSEKIEPGICGCGIDDKDTDGDSIPDCKEPNVGVIDLCLLDEAEDPEVNPNEKVLICHHTNSETNPWVEIRVSRNAVGAHISHGDHLGACSDAEDPDDGGNDDDDHGKEQLKVDVCHRTNSSKNPWVQIRISYHAVDAHIAHGDYLGICTEEDDSDKKNGANLNSVGNLNINSTENELLPWRVYNIGEIDQKFTWKIRGSDQSGEFDLPASSFIEFDTAKIDGDNIIEIYVAEYPDILADEQKYAGCAPLNTLTITPLCSDDETKTNWSINNPNERDVEVDWKLKDQDQKNLVIAKSSQSTFISTQAIDGEEMLQIFADVNRDGTVELVDSKVNPELPCTIATPTPSPTPEPTATPTPEPTPTPDLFKYPRLDEICVNDSKVNLKWNITNNNDFDVLAHWEILESNQQGDITISKNSSLTVETQTAPNENTMKLMVKRSSEQVSWEQSDVLRSTKCEIFKPTPTPTPTPTPEPEAKIEITAKVCTTNGSKFLIKNSGNLIARGNWKFTGSDETGLIELEPENEQWIEVSALQGHHKLLIEYTSPLTRLEVDEPPCFRPDYPSVGTTCVTLPETKEKRRWVIRNPNDIRMLVSWKLVNTNYSGSINVVGGNQAVLLETPYGDPNVNSKIEFYTDTNEDGIEELFASIPASDAACAIKWIAQLELRDRSGKVINENSSTDIKLKGTGAHFKARNRDTGEILTSGLKHPYNARFELGEGQWIFSFLDPSGRMKPMQRPLYPSLEVKHELQTSPIEIFFAAGPRSWVERKQKAGSLTSINAATGEKKVKKARGKKGKTKKAKKKKGA